MNSRVLESQAGAGAVHGTVQEIHEGHALADISWHFLGVYLFLVVSPNGVNGCDLQLHFLAPGDLNIFSCAYCPSVYVSSLENEKPIRSHYIVRSYPNSVVWET